PARLAWATVAAALAFGAGSARTVAELSGRTVALAEGVLRSMAVTKMKLLSVLLLALSAASAGAGLMAYQSGGGNLTGGPPDASLKPPLARADQAQPPEKRPAGTDLYGDPLPEDAVVRLGTLRWRAGSELDWLAYALDGKTLVAGSISKVCVFDAVTGKLT